MKYLPNTYEAFKAKATPPPRHHCAMEPSMGLPGFFLGILCAVFVGRPLFHAGVNVFFVFLACVTVVALMATGSMFGIAALEDRGHARRTRITEQNFVDLPAWLTAPVGDAVNNLRQALRSDVDESVVSGLYEALVTICAAAASQTHVSNDAYQGVLRAIARIEEKSVAARENALRLQAPVIAAQVESARAIEQARVEESDLQIFSALTAADIIVDTTVQEGELS